MYGINSGNITLKTLSLDRRNHKANPLSPGPRDGKLACLLKFVKGFLEGIGAVRLLCSFHCVIAFPHISLFGSTLLLKFLAQGGLCMPNSLVYFKGFEIS